MQTSIAKLTEVENEELRIAEGRIRKGLKAFIEVGSALSLIKEKRLYRQSHRTFAAYLRERWGFNKAHGYRLINSAHFLEKISPIAEKRNLPVPSNERQIRLLHRIKDTNKCCDILAEAKSIADGQALDYQHIVKALQALGHTQQVHTSGTPASNESDIGTTAGRLVDTVIARLQMQENCMMEVKLLKTLRGMLTEWGEKPIQTPNSQIEITGANADYTISHCNGKSAITQHSYLKPVKISSRDLAQSCEIDI